MPEFPTVWIEYLESQAAESTFSDSGWVTLPVTAQAQAWTYPLGSGTRSLYSELDVSRAVQIEGWPGKL